MLSLVHNAVETQVKIDYFGQPVIKPFVVHDYNLNMGGVDTSDNFLSHYVTPKCFKWSKKLLLHLISMIILNAYILNRKYGTKKNVSSSIQNILLIISLQHHLKWQHVPKRNPLFQIIILKQDSVERTSFPNWTQLLGQRGKCKVFNFTCEQLAHYGHNDLQLCNKYSSHGCKTCSHITLCITPCFKIFHSEVNYREQALAKRINELL